MPTLLVLGATSDIARASALAFGLDGWEIGLAARDAGRLEKIVADLSIRLGKPVLGRHFDALEPESGERLWNSLPAAPDAVLCAVGLLGDQEAARHDPGLAETIFRSNFSGLAPLLSLAADTFEKRGHGLIIGISSVAGDRGRASNYMYGSAKAAFSAYLSGLRNRLAGKGVRVITVKPGFVRTAMTEALPLPGFLTAEPEQAAADILNAVRKKRDTVYSRWFWRWIMLAVKAIPEAIFKRMSL